MRNIFNIIFILTLLSSCGNNNFSIIGEHVKKTEFEKFVDSIPTLDLPYELSTNDEMVHFDKPTKQVPEGAMLMGKLPSWENLHLIIYSYPADIRLPVLEVYDNDGTKLSETPLFKYNCPLDLDWKSKFLITEGYDIYVDQICEAYDSRVNRDTINLEKLLKVE